ncbi:hypothetical protein A3A40_02550 [Candidatus Kaiserbacteria bacterium RIFCSPLOWO2_01_FULL_54_20]|uniref:Uncharacterized protein n=1 Tax=Candidatus Kaiserbacteria bacterium RIFCSPLOWO2_01_FULL_54_20 TaxID=1798513 RepID=A0A1F6EJT7_9BACT|nr:MAG: hypothetical protein A3A40_02550 [Candidatus Kaiserbacteria bacterium RIFCSPLOWO2_01_FULL_54_20]
MPIVKNLLLVGLFLFLAAGVLFPNPYGNNPDIVGDESYFLSTALFSIEKMTLPGWEFSPSGAYYGGPQTYIDALVLVPVLGVVVAASDFSVMAAKIWVAINTGELLHILRLVGGIAALGTILFFFFYFKKRDIPRPLALTLTLFLFLLLSNVLVIEFLHTAKMWVFYIIFVAAMSALFIAQEYYLAHQSEPFISKNRYVALFMWSGVLTFFQSWVGAFSIALLVLYALLLRHFSFRDLWNYFLKYWWLFGLFAATQIGFLWRLYSIREIFEEITANTNILSPLSFAISSHPLIVLYPGALLVIGGTVYRNRALLADPRKRMWFMIAAMHPVLVFLIFHVGIGFDIGPRYAIFFTMAASFSAAILFGELGRKAMLTALFFSVALFAVINTHAIQLYSRQSSEVDLQKIIMEKYNSADNVFLTDWSAKRLTLPVNYESLPLQGETRLDMGRFRFLLENRGLLSKEPDFMPLAFIAYTKEEEQAYIERLSDTHSIWMVSRRCDNLCTTAEIGAGSCFELHLEACEIAPQDINALPEFLSSEQLGNSYVVRKIN